MESIALALGPLISGAIAHASHWRVSFYIIIPVGVACVISVFLFVHNLQRPENADLSGKEKMRRLDLMGFAVYVPAMVCLILGLQWAGSEYAWGNWRIILLLVLAAVLGAVFLILEHRAGDDSMIPLNMLRQRTVALSSAYTFCNSAGLFIIAYYVCQFFHIICSLIFLYYFSLTSNRSSLFISKPFVVRRPSAPVSGISQPPYPLLLLY